MKRLVILIIIIAQGAGLVGMSRAAAPGAATPLQVGYLVEGSDFVPADDPFGGDALGQRLRTALLASRNLVQAMERAGIAGVEVTPISSSGEMLQMMRSGQLHLVLCTAYTYGQFRRLGAVTPPAFDYEPILQSRRAGDIDQGRGSGMFRRGAVIVGPASPLFARKAITPADLRGALAKAPLAVPSIDSAAGYLFPLLTLAAEPYGVSRPGQFLFCYSDTDVVANVVSGLAPFGACREGAIAATLAGTADAGRSTDSLGRYCRVLLQTARFPTDPILIRDDILPSRTDVGRELKPVLREFFNTQAFDRDLRVEDAVPRAYESIERALDRMARVSAAQQTTTSATARLTPPAAAAPAATSTTATTPTNPVRPRPILPAMR